MIEAANSDPQPATRVVEQETDNVWDLRKNLEALTAKAMGVAESIAIQIKGVDELWDKLLPVFDQVEAMLSTNCNRRQVRRAIGLPTWPEWRESFLKKSGLDVSDRTAQRRLKAYRELMAPDAKNTAGHSRGTTSTERYQGLLAQQAANELFDTLFEGDDPTEAYGRYLAIRIDPDRLQQMIANCPKPREANTIGAGKASSRCVSGIDLLWGVQRGGQVVF